MSFDPTLPRCTERVPTALSGALSGAERPFCSRPLGHAGRHKVSRGKSGVGKTTWEWKTQQTPVAFAYNSPGGATRYDGFGAPISNPVPRGIKAGEIYQASACECRGMVHICAAFNGLVR